MNQNVQDYKQLLSEVIKKQIVILGPDITLVKARNIPGLIVADDGTVTDIAGDPQQMTQKLIDQFVQLSGEIVRKTMEPLLMLNQAPQTQPAAPIPAVTLQPTPPQPVQTAETPNVVTIQTPPLPVQSVPSLTPTPQPVQTIEKLPTPQIPSPVQNTLAQQPKPMQ